MERKNKTEKELYEHFGWLHQTITDAFGERCRHYDETCAVCKMWQLYDDLREAEK